MAKLNFGPFWPEGAPKAPRFAWHEGAQYKIILNCPVLTVWPGASPEISPKLSIKRSAMGILHNIFKKWDDFPQFLLWKVSLSFYLSGISKRFKRNGMGCEHGHWKFSSHSQLGQL